MPTTTRGGFTLVELLVVIFIMLLITAITIPVLAPAMRNRDVREAARMVDVFINGARSRAKLNGHPYGIMIERIPGLPNGAVTLSYCEEPDAYTGDYAGAASFPGVAGGGGSTIRLLGNGGFGSWAVPPALGSLVIDPIAFPKLDMGWIAGPAPSGPGWLTNIAPGDVLTVNGTRYRIWAGEPFLDLDQNGYCNITAGFSPNTPIGIQEPFMDVDGNGAWTPPNYPGSPTFIPGQPYVDPASGYFVQPNVITAGIGPCPVLVWGTASATMTYANFDPMQSAVAIGEAYKNMLKSPGTPYIFDTNRQSIDSTATGLSFSFSLQRRPTKTSAPSIELPGDSAIDLGANYYYSTQPPPNVISIPGSGIEVLVASANAYGWWSTFKPNPALDPSIPGTLASLPQTDPSYQPPDSTSIMITFQPSGGIDRVFSWSQAHESNGAMNVVNWSDWQGRIPAGPIYLLIGRQDLLNGDPTLTSLMAEMADNSKPPLAPIYNVQDPNALWVVIDPRSGAVATAENIGYDLESPMVLAGGAGNTPSSQMSVYWSANVYYARRLARAMLDMGGR